MMLRVDPEPKEANVDKLYIKLLLLIIATMLIGILIKVL